MVVGRVRGVYHEVPTSALRRGGRKSSVDDTSSTALSSVGRVPVCVLVECYERDSLPAVPTFLQYIPCFRLILLFFLRAPPVRFDVLVRVSTCSEWKRLASVVTPEQLGGMRKHVPCLSRLASELVVFRPFGEFCSCVGCDVLLFWDDGGMVRYSRVPPHGDFFLWWYFYFTCLLCGGRCHVCIQSPVRWNINTVVSRGWTSDWTKCVLDEEHRNVRG